MLLITILILIIIVTLNTINPGLFRHLIVGYGGLGLLVKQTLRVDTSSRVKCSYYT